MGAPKACYAHQTREAGTPPLEKPVERILGMAIRWRLRQQKRQQQQQQQQLLLLLLVLVLQLPVRIQGASFPSPAGAKRGLPCCHGCSHAPAFQVSSQLAAAAWCTTNKSSITSNHTEKACLQASWGPLRRTAEGFVPRGGRCCSAGISGSSNSTSSSSSTATRGIPHFYRWLCNQFPSCVQPLQRFVWRRPSRHEHRKAEPKGNNSNSSNNNNTRSRSSDSSSSGSSSSNAKDAAREKMLQQLLKEEKLLLQQFQSTEDGAAAAAAGAAAAVASSFSLLQRNDNQDQPQQQKQQQEVPIDALFLDFNALLHLCIHGHLPSSLPPRCLLQQPLQPLLLQRHLPLLLQRVFSYLDLIVKLVRPRSLLCITLDGVPPMAKVAQQRGRRFRQQREQQLQQQQQQQQADAAAEGATVPPATAATGAAAAASAGAVALGATQTSAPPATSAAAAAAAEGAASGAASGAAEPEGEEAFDVNSIGPGTRFMFLAEGALKRFISYKQRSSKVWGCMRAVLFSGADMPGEGEHKLMQLLTRGSWEPPSAALAEAWSSEMQQQQQHKQQQQRSRTRSNRGHAGIRLLLPPSFEDCGRLPTAVFPATAAKETAAAVPPQPQQQQQYLSHLLLAIPGRVCLYGLDADLLVLALARHRPGLLILREKQMSLRDTRAATTKKVLQRLSAALEREQQQQQLQQQQQQQQQHEEEDANSSNTGRGKRKGQEAQQQQHDGGAEREQQPQQQQPEQQRFGDLLLPASSDFLRYTARDFEVVCIDTLRRQLIRSLATAAANEATEAAEGPLSAAASASTVAQGTRKKVPGLLGGMEASGAPAVTGGPLGGPSWLRGLEPSRLIDDFVLLSFFVGNDFLPALPHINIFQGGLSSLLQAYTRALPLLGGPLTRKTQIHLPRLIRFFGLLAEQEGPHFQAEGPPGPLAPYAAEYYASKFPLQQLAAAEGARSSPLGGPAGPASRGRLPGVPFRAFRYDLCVRYISGLFFLLHYYHSGTPSWAWAFPYHYAPLASDLGALGASTLRITLPHAQPISPSLQLLAVLPPSSSQLLPGPYRRVHEAPYDRNVKDLFPSSFLVDPYPLHAVPYPGKAGELAESAPLPGEGPWDAAAVEAAMQQGREALAKALERKPNADRASQLPEWLHRPLIPFLDLPRLRTAAREALQGFKREETLPDASPTGPLRRTSLSPWSPEDVFRNRLGRPHIFPSPQLQANARVATRDKSRKAEGSRSRGGATKKAQ